jgi:hypothetical protein
MDTARLAMPLGEAIFTQRSIRRFKPEPIPLADVRLMIVARPVRIERQPASLRTGMPAMRLEP